MLKSAIANYTPPGLAEKRVPFADNVSLCLSFPFLPKPSQLTLVSLVPPPPPQFSTWGAAIERGRTGTKHSSRAEPHKLETLPFLMPFN